MRKCTGGFTLIELVAVIVILGIIAVVAIPRMDTSGYRALEFHDRTVAALRYAQKTATSHRRLVCVAFTASAVSFTIANANPSAVCNTALILPGGSNNVVQSGDTTNAVFTAPVPASLSFQPDGTAANTTLRISGQSDITIVGATGYVQ